jgi:hypothetical protein
MPADWTSRCKAGSRNWPAQARTAFAPCFPFLQPCGRANFDYRDCSLGNLVFAGAYLEKESDFNAAAAAVAELVGSRARLLNVGEQQNRILGGAQAGWHPA